jgi:glycogen debranching enzyme
VDETSVKQKYYIAAESSPADDHTRVLKYGKMFALFNRYGDIQPTGLGEQGVFFEGTRFLSRLELFLGGARPLLLSSTVKPNNSLFTADLANVDLANDGSVAVRRGTLHVVRTQFLWEGACYQKLEFFNYGSETVEVPIRIDFGADFADIFEVRGVHRKKKGRHLQPVLDQASVLLRYEGLDGKLRQTCLECYPAPASVSGASFHFDGHLDPQAQQHLTVIVACEIDPGTDHRRATRVFEDARSKSKAAHLQQCKITSSNQKFTEWVRRSQSDVRMMLLGNPEHDFPYAGVPWFSTVFGRDGIVTALECLWLDPAIARGVLEFLALTQADEISERSEAEPGKIIHEMRLGEMAAIGEVPFARYYGSVDSTPLFVMLADAYHARTGDRAFVQRIWPNIQRALRWMDEFGDADGDGFVEYSRHSDQGLVHQGWKDSNDAIFHADGSSAPAPIALCEVQGYVYAAKRGAARLAALFGDLQLSERLEAEAFLLRTHFHDAFWCEELSTYALALDGKKRPCRVRASNAGHCLYTGIAAPEAAHALSASLLAHDMFSGWGVRTLARGESRYNPISYHNGSIWPHDNAIIAAGLSRYGFKNRSGEILAAMLDASAFMELHRLPELFCGLNRRAEEGPTLYPVACSPQAWAAGAVFMLLQACLGLSFDAERRQIRFDGSCLPEAVPKLWIRDLRLRDAVVDLYVERRVDLVRLQVLDKRGEVEIVMN